MIFFILSNLIVVLSSYLWTCTFYSERNLADFILTWFSLFFGEIISVGHILGIFGLLFPLNIIILHLAVLLLAYFFFRRNYPYPSFHLISLDFILNNKLLILALSVFLGFFSVKLWLNLINPPFGADSLIFHLAYPAVWIRTGYLYHPVNIFGNIVANSTPYFPINAELFFYWLMLPFRNAFLADVGEAPFYFLGILAIYSILRKFEIRPQTALFIGLLWALIPNIFKQIKQGSYVDVICAAFFLTSLNFILILKEKFSLKNAVLCGMTLGLFLGTKRLNMFWAMALIPLFFYIFIKAKSKIFLKIGSVFIIMLCILIFGGYGYLRAQVLTGNFLYPSKVTFLGKTILPGYLDLKTMAQLYYPWKDFSLRNLFFGEGLGLQFLVFIFPGSFLPILLLPFLRKKFKPFLKTTFIFIIPAFMFLMFLFYIKAYWTRYLFAYLGAGFITAALFLNQFKWGSKFITIAGFICILSSMAEFCGHGQLIASLVITFFIFISVINLRRFKENIKKIPKIPIVILSILTLFFGLRLLNNKYDREEFDRYKYLFVGKESKERDVAVAWKWMNERSGKGSRIAYVGRADHYPLFGTRLKNEVRYVSVNDKPGLPHYYPDGLMRKEKNFSSWKENLRSERIDYIFIMLPFPYNNESGNPKEFPIEDKWARDDPQNFQLIFSNSKARIYKIPLKSR